MNATDIVAYTYQAENLCPHCIMARFNSDGRLGADVESVLDWSASISGIDRGNESSFDSGDFPKVVFANQIESDERCGGCGEEL